MYLLDFLNFALNSYIKRVKFEKITLNNQYGDASEYRSSFGIYIGNLEHPKVSRQKHSFSHVFYNGAYICKKLAKNEVELEEIFFT